MAEDPVRLLDGATDEPLRSLLSAAREEQPEARALQRTLTALGVTATISTAASSGSAKAAVSGHGLHGAAALGSAKAAGTATALVVLKWLAVGALTGALASSAAYVTTQPPRSAALEEHALPQKALAVKAPGLAPAASVSDAPSVDAPPTELPPAADASAAFAPVHVPGPAPRAAASAGAGASSTQALANTDSTQTQDATATLAAEVASLDAARQALTSGNSAEALRLLNQYDTRFREPHLLPEALYLRLEALTLQGDRRRAANVARQMLRSAPTGLHAARARAVLGLDP